MPPAHRDVPDDITPPGHEPVNYVVGPGDLTRGELRRLLADAGAGAAELSNLSRDDLVSVAKARKLEGLEVSGTRSRRPTRRAGRRCCEIMKESG